MAWLIRFALASIGGIVGFFGSVASILSFMGINIKYFMSYQNFEEIDRLHSYCSMMDKIARMAYLKSEKKRLDDMAYRYGLYLQSKGGFITDEERTMALHLVEMLDSVQEEGEKTQAEFNSEWRNELRKQAAKILLG